MLMPYTQVEEFQNKTEFNAWLKGKDKEDILKVYRSADKVYFVWYIDHEWYK